MDRVFFFSWLRGWLGTEGEKRRGKGTASGGTFSGYWDKIVLVSWLQEEERLFSLLLVLLTSGYCAHRCHNTQYKKYIQKIDIYISSA